MIAKLEKEAYCDKELAESKEKKGDKTADIEMTSTRIERAPATTAQLKEGWPRCRRAREARQDPGQHGQVARGAEDDLRG